MKLLIEIRKFKESDLDECISLFRDTVHAVNTKHYTQSQLDIWAPANIDKAAWNKRLVENITYVAIYNNRVVGFGCMTPQGYFDLLFVHKNFQRQGIAKSIVLKFEALAKQLGIKEITTETSITAKPFRESMGYHVVKKQLKEFRGEKFINYIMKKVINGVAVKGSVKLSVNPELIKATIVDYPVIQNLARFYVYDLSRYCGFISEEWACPPDGLYTDVDLKNYFKDSTREAYLIKIGHELAGFSLLHNVKSFNDDYWVVAEFFILAKFQGHGLGVQIAEKIWKMHSGKWEVPVIPENTKALAFWRKTILSFTKGHYQEEIKNVDYDKYQPKRYILSFDTKEHNQPFETITVRKATETDISYMTALSLKKRRAYENAQPKFWRYAEGAEEKQAQWFEELLQNEDYILLVAESVEKIMGFIIARIMSAPPVYNPGGLTSMVDDFCVADTGLWNTVGKELISKVKLISKSKDATQIIVVCGAHDEAKRQFLQMAGLAVASEWYIGEILS